MHLSNKPAMGKKSTRTETVLDDDDSDDEKHEKPKPKPKKSKTEPATLALSDKPANTGKKGKAAKVKKLSVWETPWATKEEKKKNWSSWPSVWQIARMF